MRWDFLIKEKTSEKIYFKFSDDFPPFIKSGPDLDDLLPVPDIKQMKRYTPDEYIQHIREITSERGMDNIPGRNITYLNNCNCDLCVKKYGTREVTITNHPKRLKPTLER